MGSASTNLKCGLGGFEGRRFAFGDVVNFHDTTPNPTTISAPTTTATTRSTISSTSRRKFA